MSGYDRWLEAPYADQPEGEECEDCLGEGVIYDQTGTPLERCKRCEGEGTVAPPTAEDIAEVRAEREFDAQHDEGRI